jgi:2-polyprenyl-6-methoxyphenol hydroxylase-like FAD-dependent oxidoreductase
VRGSTIHRTEHAVVVGASMAGLLAARVLADRFARVTVIERDALPATASVRRGVPQAHHTHVLLASGRAALARIIPELDAALAAAGAPLVDPGVRGRWRGKAGWMVPPGPSDLAMRCASRPLLEHVTRTCVRAHPRVGFRDDLAATGLVAGAGGRIRGVALAGGDHLAADLVIDACGRASRLPQWLAALGHAAPAEDVVESHAGYASAMVERLDLPAPIALLFLPPFGPDQPRGGAVFPIEGGRHLVTLYGIRDDVPPTDEAAWRDFAGSLSSPAIGRALGPASVIGAVRATRTTANRWRRWDLRPPPPGVIALGDSFAAFNPVYGQGITVAALEALALGDLLDRTGDAARATREAPRRFARLVRTAWLLATSEDLRFPSTEGARPPWLRALYRASDGLQSLCTRDGAATLAFARVTQMITPPLALAAPRMATRIAAHAIGLVRPDAARAVPELLV